MKRVLFICIAIILMSFSVNAFSQHYTTALGVRLGNFSGFTVKHFINSQNPIEGQLSFRWGGFVITGLYEYQKPTTSVDNLDWFVGVGGHIGFWNTGYYYYNGTNTSYTILGADLIGGLEYSFSQAPFTVGLEWKPAFNLIGDTHFLGDDVALTLRYHLK